MAEWLNPGSISAGVELATASTTWEAPPPPPWGTVVGLVKALGMLCYLQQETNLVHLFVVVFLTPRVCVQ